MILARLLCLWKPHVYRRARKGESAGHKFCKRCGKPMAIKRRVGASS